MSNDDRRRWDVRHGDNGVAPSGDAGPPPLFAYLAEHLPNDGSALDVACGRGRGTVWLARHGLRSHGIDVSPIAIGLARQLAVNEQLEGPCTFAVHDLDDGLPDGPPVDVVTCHLFRHESLDQQIIDRLSPGGIVAMGCLSEVDHGPGAFRARPGELTDAFAELTMIAADEKDGHAWYIGRKSSRRVGN